VAVREGWIGRYYEDFAIGDVYQRPYGRTISEADNTWFTLLTLNTNPMHFDTNLAEKSEFGQLLVNSALTVAIVIGMSVVDTSQNAFANLGWDHIRLTHPVFVGDTLYVETRVLDKRESKSRPHAGIVKVQTRGLNQNGDVCLSFTRSFFAYKRQARDVQSVFPTAKEPWTEEG
jgi:itaconyl-CoA hydratase